MGIGLLLTPPGKELRSLVLWRDVWGEVMCSTILVFTGVSVGFRLSDTEDPMPILTVALANGFVVAALIETMGHICGAVMNPVVTIMFMFTKKISPCRAVIYIVAQCTGGILGSFIAYGVTNEYARTSIAPIGLNGISQAAGVGCEAFITHTMTLAVQSSGDSDKRPVYMPGIIVGLSVVVGILTAGRLTGAAMNPLTSLGVATVTGDFTNHWVYWVGPMCGMAIAVLEYNLIYSSFWPKKSPEESLDSKYVPEQNGSSAHDNYAYDLNNSTDAGTKF